MKRIRKISGRIFSWKILEPPCNIFISVNLTPRWLRKQIFYTFTSSKPTWINLAHWRQVVTQPSAETCLTLSQWVSSTRAPKEYSLHALSNWKRTPTSTDGFAYHIEINMAKMGGIEKCLFPRETSYIPTDGNTSIQQALSEPLLCARPCVRCQWWARGGPFTFTRLPYGWSV